MLKCCKESSEPVKAKKATKQQNIHCQEESKEGGADGAAAGGRGSHTAAWQVNAWGIKWSVFAFVAVFICIYIYMLYSHRAENILFAYASKWEHEMN